MSRQGISYRIEGVELEPVLLVHGVGSSAATWSRLSPLLRGKYRLISYDLRGHGASAKTGGTWSLDDFVSDHLGLVDELALSGSHLVGFSLGALIALGVAVAAPGAVRTLVLLNCVSDRHEDDRSRALERLEFVRSHGMEEIAQASASRWFTTGFLGSHPVDVEREVAIVGATDHAMYMSAYEVLAKSDLIGQAYRVQSPTLLITGEHDVGSTPRMSASLGAHIPRSTVKVVAGRKHYLHVECPDVIAELITNFLSLSRQCQRER